ncbi:uncharacterized protein BYT42DRAFT_487665 [Radiomyces spectabilis]|uniref:uncharacterized protein n=1 Tax=Radiomyces spectabilis TaxID=64574 RepID=UPI00221FD13D|nr:uncharacterized protein BYT42DRAFT_487665 [Radiomyces spectabilis]KAI8394321.1 hypothetical protein BYT42DRAFT_487665 [Radiomyces spectabilis]
MYFSLISAALVLVSGDFVSAQSATASGAVGASSTSPYLPQTSPAYLSNITKPSGVVDSYNFGPYNTSATLSHEPLNLKNYPKPWGKPDPKHPEVQAAMKTINWDKVPKAPTRKGKSNGDLITDNYDEDKDPYCWWSDTNCVKPKVSYLPEDIYMCPNVGDWGLTYDDGPFNPNHEKGPLNDDKWAEPQLYNWLAEHGNQKATLFYIGSNVVTFPEAAKRGLNHGHYLCSHTWSHPQMTTMSNEEAVAEFYWTLKAIKEATGVTVKCWRPPYGDVDDRIRSIAWQMGMRTVLWNLDTNDWDMPGDGGGDLAPSKVDGYFQGWIDKQKAGKYKTGHILLEHELNNSTVSMTEKWLPKLQQVFNVVPALACQNITHPYWEEQFVYPTEAHNTTKSHNSNSSQSQVSASGAASSVHAASIQPSAQASAQPSSQASENVDAGKNNNNAAAQGSDVKNLDSDSSDAGSLVMPTMLTLGAAAFASMAIVN